MLNRLPFWLGLLLGAFAAFRLRLLNPRLAPSTPTDFRDFVTDAFLVCDRAGTIREANAPAQALFGSNRLPALRYPTGQRVPPGQHPLRRAASARETNSGCYHQSAADGAERVFNITARPLPGGRAAAVFRDITVHREGEAREQAAQARQTVMQAVCRRLSLAPSAEAIGQAVAEETLRLLSAVPNVQVRLYVFDPAADTLTCLASAPDDRPKRPKSAAEARPATVRFNAEVPEHWQMYVARKPSPVGLPLVASGVAIGHLSVTSPASAVFEDPAVREALELIASLAALALAGPSASAQAAAYAAQAAAVREIAAALKGEPGALADTVTAAVKRVTHAEVCTLSVPVGSKLRVLGDIYKDDLLFPQTAPDAPRLHSKAAQKARKTQKPVTYLGLPNPSLEAGPWRAFAGTAGCHSVIALPLAATRGVLSVYTDGASPLPDTQIKFLETVAALLSLETVEKPIQPPPSPQ